MNIPISSKIGAAMGEQVKRVNRAAKSGVGGDDDLRAENAQLRQRIAALEAEIAALKSGAGAAAVPSKVGMVYDGRPAMTLAQAAAARGVSYHAARRACERGRWEAVRVVAERRKAGARDYGKWIVFDG